MRLVLFGAPGSGKGTQGPLLAQRLKIKKISTGDMLREEVAKESPFGLKVKEIIGRGALVPDDLMIAEVEKRIKEPDVANGFILDGFPRSIPQAEGFDGVLKRAGMKLDGAIKLEITKSTLMERLLGRRSCPDCYSVFNVTTNPPKVEGKCDKCGGELVHRPDDKAETVGKRFTVYENATTPLVDYYKQRGLLLMVNADGPVDVVAGRIVSAIDGRPGA